MCVYAINQCESASEQDHIIGLFPLHQFPLCQFPLVNSHLVNVDKVGIDKVGIDEVGSWRSGKIYHFIYF